MQRIISIFIVLAIMLSALALYGCDSLHSYGEIKTSLSDCTQGGYNYKICENCGRVEYEEVAKQLDHSISEYWDDIINLERFGYCDICKKRVVLDNYQPPNGIPSLFFEGSPNGTVVPVEVNLYHGDIKHTFFADVSIDGNESNSYYKKDYDITAYEDVAHSQLAELSLFDSIGTSNAYTLRSEYHDKTLVRNLSCSALYRQMRATSVADNSPISRLKYYGTEEGVPVLFYTNGNFKGVYSLCTPNNHKLFELDNQNQMMIYTYPSFNQRDFVYSTNSTEKNEAVVMWPLQEQSKAAVANSFESFSDFIVESNEINFTRNLSRRLDVNAAIDYLIALYVFGASSNVTDYCNWISYNGTLWTPSMYNLTYTLGLNEKIEYVTPESSLMPSWDDEQVLSSNTNVALWDKLCKYYSEQIRERYTFLRSETLTTQSFSAIVQNYSSMIPEIAYKAELDEYPNKVFNGTQSNTNELISWFDAKLKLLDEVLLIQQNVE